jgi:predicted anti-sigma-YlaC factor YlaD
MDCERAQALLLEADVTELSGESDSDLARHLRTCAACRRGADAIRQAERDLGAWLAHAAPRTEESLAVARAAATARRRSAARRTAAVGGMAAAALAGLVVLSRRSRPPAEAAAAPPAAAAPGFFVTAPPGREIVVLHTANPKIVVVWFLPSRRSS